MCWRISPRVQLKLIQARCPHLVPPSPISDIPPFTLGGSYSCFRVDGTNPNLSGATLTDELVKQ